MQRDLLIIVVFLMTAGTMLTIMGALDPDWSDNGTGEAGLYSVCGGRNISPSCKVSGGANATNQRFFTGETTCSQYTATGPLAAITAGLALIAAVGIISSRGAVFNHMALEHMDMYDGVTMGSLTLAFAMGAVAMSLYLEMVLSSGKNGLAGTGNGLILFITGWAMLFIPWLMWVASLNSLAMRSWLTNWGMIGTSNFWIIASVALLAASLVTPDWNKVLVRQDLITPPDFATIDADMHAVVGVAPADSTLGLITATIIAPAPAAADPNRKLSLNPWGYALCTPIQSNCKWRTADFFKGDDCDQFVGAQSMAWIAVILVVLSLLIMAGSVRESLYGWMSLGGVSLLALASGVIAIILYIVTVDPISPGTSIHGDGFVMFSIGVLLTGLVGTILGCSGAYDKWNVDDDDDYTSVPT